MQSLSQLVDSEGRHFQLGDLVGKGGEGEVYGIVGDDTVEEVRFVCFDRDSADIYRALLGRR